MQNPIIPQHTTPSALYSTNPTQPIPGSTQKYLYIDPGRQPYINPAFISRNQNYYQSPIIPNPPARQYPTYNYGMYDPYTNNYNNYYGYQQYNCGCQQQSQYNYGNYGNCGGCNQWGQYYAGQYAGGCQGYSLPVYNGQYGCSCPGNCSQYGLSINRGRLTPNFPSKLGHSYVTSGSQVQNKQVITQPTGQSAPFQTQRRKTYVPYTRKYIDYQDYIQYIPVQKSQWAYKKVMKQVDFVPQQYYESSIEVVPRERLQHRVRYVPVQQEIVHVPNEMMQRAEQRTTEIKRFGRTNDTLLGTQGLRQSSHHFTEQQRHSVIPSNMTSSSANRFSVPIGIDRQVINTVISQNQGQSVIRPAQSTVQMVPRNRFQPLIQQQQQQSVQQSSSIGGGSNLENQQQQGSYQFPQSGGVMIGSSSQSASQNLNPALSSFGPGGGIRVPESGSNIQASQVIHSVYGVNITGQNSNQQSSVNKETQYVRNLRDSGKIQSQDFNFDRADYNKKHSIFHKFEEEQN